MLFSGVVCNHTSILVLKYFFYDSVRIFETLVPRFGHLNLLRLMAEGKSCIITQSNYIPWKGYFDGISRVDTFIVYDDMQYTKRDWRNRNLMKTPQGLRWLSIPVQVSGKYHQKINETMVSEPGWNKSHLDFIRQNFQKAPCFQEVWPWVQELYMNCGHSNLTDINLYFIEAIMSFLGIKTEIRYSSEFNLHEDRNLRLINICLELGASNYFSGPAAKNYMEESLFTEKGIKVHYFDYSGYPEYPQLHPPFEHGVSIFDLIFNLGEEAKNYYSNGKK